MLATDPVIEFSRNFTALQVKYEELDIRHTEAVQKAKDLATKLETARKEIERRDEAIKQLKNDLGEALQFKERLAKATVSAEHLRGRVETYRKAMEEKDLEHRHETEQLRAQLADVMSRVASNADSQLVSAVRNQKVELEERCAVMSSQLMEEKERAVQQQMAAVASVRDLAARNLELEQRCRSLDAEVSQLRATSRRQNELATEASMERERLLAETGSLSARLHAATREVASANARSEERAAALETHIAERTASFTREREDLMAQVADAQKRVSDMMSLRAADADRVGNQQRAASGKLEALRGELENEIETATKAKHSAMEETQRIKVKLAQERLDGEETRAALRAAEARQHATQLSLNSTQARLDNAVQNEAWLTAERDRLAAVVEKTTQRCESLANALQAAEARALDIDKLNIQLQSAHRDLGDAAAQRERELEGVRRLEEAYQGQLRAAQREAKALKRRYTKELEKEERQKKILLKALLEQEQAVHPVPSSHGGPKTLPNGGAVAAATTTINGGSASPYDALSLLKAQGEAAREFQRRLQQLDDPTSVVPL